MSLGLGELESSLWLDDFMAREGYEAKKRYYHRVVTCWCGSRNLSALGVASDIADMYQCCNDCQCIIARYLLPIEGLPELYGIRYFREHQAAIGLPTFQERYELDALDRIPIWTSILRKYLRKGKVLELGSSHGRFVKELTKLGYHAVGFEMDPEISEWARQKTGCDIRCSTIEQSRNEKFNVIFANDVLEHLYDPLIFVNNVMQRLLPKGKALFQTVVLDADHSYPFTMMRPLFHTILFSRRSLELFTTESIKLLKVMDAPFGCQFIILEKKEKSILSYWLKPHL